MKKFLPLPLFILVFSAAAFAQSDLPQIGKLDDIKGKTKFYLVADTFHSKLMLKEIAKQKALIRVDRAEDAEFFIEYKALSRQPFGETVHISETGELRVYFYKDDKKKVIVWADTHNSHDIQPTPSDDLMRKFLKEIGIK